VLAATRALGAYRESWMSYLNLFLGAWLFAAAFWLDSSAAAEWNDLASGAAIMALGLLSAAASDEGALAGPDRRWYRW
jgi:hypothetical protein